MSERSAVPYLLLKTLGELAALPFHLVAFVVSRRAIRADIAEVLASEAARRRSPSP